MTKSRLVRIEMLEGDPPYMADEEPGLIATNGTPRLKISTRIGGGIEILCCVDLEHQ